LEKLLEITFHFEVKSDFLNKMNVLNTTKKIDFLAKKIDFSKKCQQTAPVFQL